MSGKDPNGGAPREPAANLPRIPGLTLLYEIARGGMGVVYCARQDFIDRRVAVKFLSVELGGQSFAQRFQREAKILAGIKHPNIVACHVAGTTEDGQSYLVMEYVDGPNLKSWIADNGPMAPVTAVRLARAVAQALAHAHQLDIIHRDVKPENILLETITSTAIDVAFPFTPKIVDLGLARATHDPAGAGLTSPGSVMGTPSTMSPEQFDEPDSVDFRTDIYGLGCVLYEMLVGKAAYRGNRLTDIVARKRQPVGPNPCAENPSVPAAVGALVQSMLASNRSDRPASYRELDEQFDALLQVLGGSQAHRDRSDERQFSGTAATIAGIPPAAPARPDEHTPSGPGLLRTAELDFLSAGSAAASPTPTAFRTSGVTSTVPALEKPPEPGRRRAALLAAAVLLVAIVVGAWLTSGGRNGRGGRIPTDNGLPAIVSITGPDRVDLGDSFSVIVTATDPDDDQLSYFWSFPRGVSLIQGGNLPRARFRIDDGLPGVEFELRAEVRDGYGEPVVATHRVVVGDCPEEQPLIGFDALPRWRIDRRDLRWNEHTDPDDRHVTCRAGQGKRTLATALGDEDYWEWFGTLRSEELDDNVFATLGLRFDFGDRVFAVSCSRSDRDGELWRIELVEALRAGSEWQYRSLPRPYRVEWREPHGNDDDYRASFSVQRRGDLLRVQLGEARVPAPSEENPRPVEQVRVEQPVDIELPAGSRAGDLTLFVDRGRGLFRVRKR